MNFFLRRRELLSLNNSDDFIIYDNGVINPILNTSFSSNIINGDNGSGRNGGITYDFPVTDGTDSWIGIKCAVDSSYMGGLAGAFAGFTTSTKIEIPSGYTKINAILRSRDWYNSTNNRGAVGINLWSAQGDYNADAVPFFKLNTTSSPHPACQTEGEKIILTDDNPEIYTAWLVSSMDTIYDDGERVDYQITRTNNFVIPSDKYYIGAYIRRTTSSTGGYNGNSCVIRKLWLSK